MTRLSVVAAAVLFSIPAAAQTGPCSGGTNPLFSAAYSRKDGGYQLTFEHLDPHTYSSPRVSFSGMTISVAQTPVDIPPPPALGAAALQCNSQTVSLGALTAGTYTVVWSYTLPSPLPGHDPIVLASFTYSFSAVGPCSQFFAPRISLQHSSSGWRLRYEHSFGGYQAVFGTPSASLSGNSLTIVQPVSDVVPPTGGEVYPAPPRPFCDAEEVSLPALGAGVYGVNLTYVVSTPDLPPAQYSGGSAGFIIGPSLDVQCTTTRTFSTFPAPPVAGAKATLLSTLMATGAYAGTEVAQQGHVLVLTDHLQAGTQPAHCLDTSAVVGPLESGTYTVQWQVFDTFSFQVAAWSRHHAAR